MLLMRSTLFCSHFCPFCNCFHVAYYNFIKGGRSSIGWTLQRRQFHFIKSISLHQWGLIRNSFVIERDINSNVFFSFLLSRCERPLRIAAPEGSSGRQVGTRGGQEIIQQDSFLPSTIWKTGGPHDAGEVLWSKLHFTHGHFRTSHHLYLEPMFVYFLCPCCREGESISKRV